MKSAVCAYCSHPFEYTDKGKIRKFCSHECYAASMVGSDRGGWINATCMMCGLAFTMKRSRTVRTDAKPTQYCSHECRIKGLQAGNQKHSPIPCLTCGKVFSPRTNNGKLSEFCSQRCAGDSGRNCQALIAKQEAGIPTSIERRMMDALDRLGIGYVPQYPIFASNGLKRYVCDIAIVRSMLIVECDGDYWHSLPKAIASDKRKNKYLKQRGYQVLRFTETQINSDADACAQIVASIVGL